MLFWIFLVILVLCFIAFVGIIVLSLDDQYMLPAIAIPTIIAFVPLIVIAESIGNHANDLSTLRFQSEIIDVREQAVKDIDEQLLLLSGQLDGTPNALMNADSPVNALVTTKTMFVKEIADARMSIINAKTDIESRSIGLMSGVVTLYGKE